MSGCDIRPLRPREDDDGVVLSCSWACDEHDCEWHEPGAEPELCRVAALEAREQAWREAAMALARHPRHIHRCAAYTQGRADAHCGHCTALALLERARGMG